MKHHSSFSPLLLCAFLLLCPSQPSSAQEAEDEMDFDYIKGSKKGPGNWGYLKKEWSVCRTGKLQSPVDLSTKRLRITSGMGKLRARYRPCNATIKNRGHDIAVEWEGDAGWFWTNFTRYKLVQAHWHLPSEHTVDGKRYDMEFHMVHQTNDPNARHKLAVVALLYEIGRPNPFLSKLMNNVTLSMDDDDVAPGIHRLVDPNDINMQGQRYYRYIGSLTIPPCTEDVLWTVIKRVRTVSNAQVAFLRDAVHDFAQNNARPVQPLNRRWVYFNTPRNRSN